MENEKRLIDANAFFAEIERRFCVNCDYFDGKCEECLCLKVGDMLANTPTVDAEEEVRCEKCEHWEKVYGGQFCRQFGYCNECKMDTPSDHFCSYGERREGE